MADNNTGRERRAAGLFPWVFPAALLYYELLLRIFTVRGLFRPDTLLLVPLCCAYGGVGYLLCTAFRKREWNYRLTAVLLLGAALPYLVEVFIFLVFKVFYDAGAVFGQAGHVVKGFGGVILKLIFSGRGLLRIGLYLLPGVLYILFGSAPMSISGKKRGLALARMAAFFLISAAVVHMAPGLARAAGEAYNFNTAVERFGLLTGVGLEARQELLGGGAQFVQEERLEMPSASPESPADADGAGAEASAPVPETVYGPNQLDLPLDDPQADSQTQALNAYVASQEPTMKNQYTGLFEGKNLIMITAEAFCREVIDPERTPTLYRMATKGVNFNDYYQFAGSGTIGGEYQHIFGLVPTADVDSFKMITEHAIQINMGSQLSLRGYYGKAFHNNDYTYYDRNLTHNKMGYSDGFMGCGNGMEEYVQNVWPESDYEMFTGTVPTFIDRQPFSIYYMTVSGHNLYEKNENAMAAKNWDRVAELDFSDQVKGYLAANMELEDAMTYLIGALEEKGIADDTVICLTGDHFPYGLDYGGGLGDMPYLSELYGYEVEDPFQRDHNAWLLWCGSLEDADPIVVDSPTSSLDILPTLSNLFGIDYDSRLLPGRDALSDAPALVFNILYNWKSDLGTYYVDTDTFVPSVDESLIPDNYVQTIKTVVNNKINYCQGVLETDYYTYLFWR